MSPDAWMAEEKTLPKLGFLGQGNHGYVSLVRTPDGLLMAKKTSFRKYAANLEKEVRILQHFHSINYNIVRATSNLVYYETMPINVKVCSIYMEVAPHGSLKDMIAIARGRLPENVVGYCARLILEGLRDLHRDGYVHCDLKAENILIFHTYTPGELCELKLADFGLAKEPNGPDPVDGSLFEESPRYLAPEAVGPHRVISSKVDIWSLGFLIYDMLGINEVERYVPGYLSSVAADFVWKCTKRNPAERSTAEELLSHPFVGQSFWVPPFGLLPPCLSNGVIQGRLF